MKELKGIDHHDDDGDICPICGEREIAFGEEYCTECLVEMKKLDSKQPAEEEDAVEEPETLEVIDEIEDIPIDEEEEVVPPFELEHINEELGADDEVFFEEEPESEDEDAVEPIDDEEKMMLNLIPHPIDALVDSHEDICHFGSSSVQFQAEAMDVFGKKWENHWTKIQSSAADVIRRGYRPYSR